MTVEVQRCGTCGRAWHPAPRQCPACGGEPAPLHVLGNGHVLSWTRVLRPPAGFNPPQRVVLVALALDGQTVSAFAAAEDDSLLESGRSVRVTTDPDGRLVAHAD